jgi:hypothetical protein
MREAREAHWRLHLITSDLTGQLETMGKNHPVTAEVASSTLVVPPFFQALTADPESSREGPSAQTVPETPSRHSVNPARRKSFCMAFSVLTSAGMSRILNFFNGLAVWNPICVPHDQAHLNSPLFMR